MENEIRSIIDHYHEKIIRFPSASIAKNNLTNGRLGMIHYYIHTYRSTEDKILLQKISELFQLVFNDVHDGKQIASSPLLSNGLSGLGLVLHESLKYGLIDENYNKQLDIITDLVYGPCINLLQKNNFDFLHGSIGILNYLIQAQKFEQCNSVVNVLQNIIEENHGIIYNKVHDKYTEGINFGIAHGLSGIINSLLNLYEKNESKLIIESIIDNIFAMLLKYQDRRMLKGCYINFPYNLYFEHSELKSRWNYRLSWCNSDLSVAFSLFRAGYLLKNPAYKSLAKQIADDTLSRKHNSVNGIQDYHFCHGSSGVATLYHMLYDITKDINYYNAYIYWLNTTTNYLNKEKDIELSSGKVELLAGLPGAVLTLNSFLMPEFAEWSKLFLV